MATTGSPTAIKRWIAFTLKRLREQSGKSRQELAELLDCNISHLSHLETGRNLPSALESDALLDIYGVGDRKAAFRELLRSAKKGKDWWKTPVFKDAEPEWFDLYLGLEAWARDVQSYDALVVPGLFQTSDYARALITAAYPELTDTEVQRRVDLRMARQAALDREPEPLRIWSVLDEAALRRVVGGPAVMRTQLDRLVELAGCPTITVQVLPATAGAHGGLDGTFTVLDFPLDLVGDPGTVYVQTRLRGAYYEEPAQIDEYRQALRRLQVQAIKPEDAPAFIARIAEEIGS